MRKLEWETKKVKVKDLIQLDINPRKISEEKKQKLLSSLDKYNLVEIPAVNIDMEIIGGNQRVAALMIAGRGEDEIDVRVPNRMLTRKEVKEYAIISNTHAGEFDFDVLNVEFSDININELGFEIIGLDEWNKNQDKAAIAEAKEDDFEIPDQVETDIVLGDLFEIGEHRLLCGDSTDSDQVAKLMNGQKADMVFTDPPYGMKLDTDYTKMPVAPNGAKPLKHNSIKGDNEDFVPELINTIFACFNYCKEIFIWGADYFAELLPNKNEGSWMVWDKRVDENFDKMIGSAFELCWSKSKHQRKIARINNTLFSGEQDAKNKVHPTQKPIKLVTFFFDNWGNNNDLVADLFLGSGSTMVASHQLNRKCYGMELDPKYCQVIVDRMIKLDPNIKILKNGKEIKSL